MNILKKGAPLIFKNGPPAPKSIRQFPSSLAAKSILSNWLSEALREGDVRVSPSRPKVVSPVFAIPKPNQPGEYRLCFDLRYLNSYLKVPSFKLDSLSMALQAVTPGCFFTKTDLKSGFSHVKVSKKFRTYLGFELFGQYFTYRVLPFGLASSPYFFGKMLAPVICHLRSRGVRIFAYVDDLLVIAPSESACRRHTALLRRTLKELGWVVREDKSSKDPSQEVLFLGFLINSLSMTCAVPPRKAHAMTHEFRRFALRARTSKMPRRVVARMCGLANSVSQVFPLAHALSRRLLFDLKSSPGPWVSSMTVSPKAVEDLLLLAEMLSSLRPTPLVPPSPTLQLRTDASLEGWGAHCLTTSQKFSGTWDSDPELRDLQSINQLEILAAFRALQSLNPPPSSVVLLETDNTTAVAYLSRFAGRNPQLFELSRQVQAFCSQRDILLMPRFLPGSQNQEADSQSRSQKDWELASRAFKMICQRLSVCPTIDRFASPSNTKLPRFNSRLFHPKAEAANAMTQDWSQEVNYWAPPLALLSKTVAKIQAECAQGILLTPRWVGRWLPMVLQLADSVVPVPMSFVRSTGSPFETKSSELLAWRISGASSSQSSPAESETWWPHILLLSHWEVSSRA